MLGINDDPGDLLEPEENGDMLLGEAETGIKSNPLPDLPDAPEGLALPAGNIARDDMDAVLEIALTTDDPIATLPHAPLPNAPALWLIVAEICGRPAVRRSGPCLGSLVGELRIVSATVIFVYSWVFSLTMLGSPNIWVPGPWNGAFALEGISRTNPHHGRYESPSCFGEVVVLILISIPNCSGV